VVNGILDMTKLDTGDFEIRPEPFRPAGVIGGCCDLLALKARQAGLELVVESAVTCRDVADKRALKQILITPVERHKTTDGGGRVRILPPSRAPLSRSRSRTTASASAKRICRASAGRSSRRATPTTGVMTAPASASRSSRAWWRCTAAT
jgi:hypothetical protein